MFSGRGRGNSSTWCESSGEDEARSSTEAAAARRNGLRMNDRRDMVVAWGYRVVPNAKECPGTGYVCESNSDRLSTKVLKVARKECRMEGTSDGGKKP